jgi:hypothetical protein
MNWTGAPAAPPAAGPRILTALTPRSKANAIGAPACADRTSPSARFVLALIHPARSRQRAEARSGPRERCASLGQSGVWRKEASEVATAIRVAPLLTAASPQWSSLGNFAPGLLAAGL